MFDSSDLIPVVGAREDGTGVTTPLERECTVLTDLSRCSYFHSVYGKTNLDVVVLQQRSPVLKVRIFFTMTTFPDRTPVALFSLGKNSSLGRF